MQSLGFVNITLIRYFEILDIISVLISCFAQSFGVNSAGYKPCQCFAISFIMCIFLNF